MHITSLRLIYESRISVCCTMYAIVPSIKCSRIYKLEMYAQQDQHGSPEIDVMLEISVRICPEIRLESECATAFKYAQMLYTFVRL